MGDVEGFLQQRWATAPHLWPGDVAGFDDLLSLADVDHILASTAPRTPAFRLVRDGEAIDPGAYTREARVGASRYQGLADPARIFQHFDEGATIVLQSLQRSWAPVSRFCRQLELALTHPVQANAYLTPAGATGLAPHHDTHDVFVLQVHGHKRWRVAEPVVPAPLPRHRSDPETAAASPTVLEAELEPGHCLYLPRGFVHAATAQTGVSLHLTVGVLNVTVHDLLRTAIDVAADDPRFRATLPPGFATGDDALAGLTETTMKELSAWLVGALDPAEVASRVRRRFWSGRPPLLEGQLQQLADLDQLTDADVVARRPGSIWVSEPSDHGRLRVLLGDRRLELPGALEAAVHRLVAGPPVRVGDLADALDGPSRLVLVRRLVREGLLEVRRG